MAEPPESADMRVATVCEYFLQWSQRHRAPRTYEGYRFYVQKFSEACGYLLVTELRPYHITRWIDGKKQRKSVWGPTSQFNAVRTALRIFNWAVKEKLIKENPIKGMERPRQRSRRTWMKPEEFRALRRTASPTFRLLLIALWQTGARPTELRNLTWDQVQEDFFFLPEHKTEYKVQKPRVIYLSPRMKRIIRFLRSRSKSKYVFVNCYGQPWTANAVRLQIQRLKKKLNLREELCAYEIRHAYGAQALVNDVPIATVAELMGHQDTTMICRIYGHLADQTDHLRAAAAKAVTSKRDRTA